LASDEIATILRKDEEVLNSNDPRHIRNYVPQPSEATHAPQPLRQVLVMNPADLAAAMSGSHGENVVVTHIKNNTGTIRTMLNGGR
jgi:hypothetical protein